MTVPSKIGSVFFMPETLIEARFTDLGLPQNILDTIDRLGFVTPTPIQHKSIPVALRGGDMVGIAQTGTGKTLAFGLPITALLQPDRMALVLAPTRELAEQIAETFEVLDLRTALLIGGEGFGKQKSQLRNRPQVVVATPGRLEDHIRQGYRALKHVDIVVLDEADRMLDMGFAPAIHRLFGHLPTERQTMLFSATMPKEIANLAATYLKNPTRIDIQPAGTTAEGIDQELIMVDKTEKPEILNRLLEENRGSVLVFARTRHGARKIAHAIRVQGHTAAEIHADRSMPQRRAALEGFKTGEFRILVATDIAARGIDVKEISLVINYDVPEKPEDYVHRIGRTGRAGATGRAIMVATPEQARDVRDIERLMGLALEISPLSRRAYHAVSPQSDANPARKRSRSGPPRERGTGFQPVRNSTAPVEPREQDNRKPRFERKPETREPGFHPRNDDRTNKPRRPRNTVIRPISKTDAPIEPQKPRDPKPPQPSTKRPHRKGASPSNANPNPPSNSQATKKPRWNSAPGEAGKSRPASNPKPRRLKWTSKRRG